ncbi:MULTISPECIES: hypothetical protein [Alloalcanivorax]|jgi:hypothetical protein|nr:MULTISPECIES: hypothetical protein [Alloalcanivorax]ARB45752.1 hypothetical protein P40_10290 [Alloalcanivorax xenomutans]ERS13894.1 hypothetical protein Q668_12565 [Alcanivorax sp. PN-3]GGJ84142.1 hypothetical protein GCM10007426_11540 [Alloalcanivorax dieselolei]
MNVFSTIDNPTWAIELTEDNYIRKTGRDQRYVRQKGAQRKARYALCPKCQGPIMLINYIIPQTETEVLYGKHVQYNVEGLANYSQHAYENCPLKNPLRIDKGKRRAPGSAGARHLLEFIKQHLDIIFSTMEECTGIRFNKTARQHIVRNFAADKAWEYESVSTNNTPYAFLYFSEAIDLYGCRLVTKSKLNQEIRQCIDNSTDFRINIERYSSITRSRNSGKSLRLFFSNHTVSGSEENIKMHIVERDPSQGHDFYTTLLEKKVSFDQAKFINTCGKRSQIQELAAQYL